MALVRIGIIISYITKALKLLVVKLTKCFFELMYFPELIWRNANVLFKHRLQCPFCNQDVLLNF